MQKQIVLDEWQKEVLAAEGNILLCTGRQVGKTTIFARKAAKYMLDHPNTKIIIVSLTEDQAKLIIIMILDYLETYHRLEISKGKNKPTQNKIILKNGSQALARPVGNTGDAVRGFTGDVLIIDEASRMPELVWAAGRPTLLTTAGQIWLCSTPYGKQGYFWEAFQNKNNRFKVFHISSEEVITNRPLSASWTEKQRIEAIKFLEGEKQEMSELRYGQEYLGLFIDELRQYFDDELIEKCCTLNRRGVILHDRTYSLGVDIARMGYDESTFEIIDMINDETYEHIENMVTKKTLTTQTEDMILSLNRTYDFARIYIDAGSGSLGVGIFDHLLRDDETKRKVVAINNRARVMDKDEKQKTRLLKEDLYDNLRSMMQKGQIKLLNDADVKLSLKSVQYDYSDKDKGLSQLKIFGNYTHIAEGLIRAAWIAKEKSLNIWIKSIRI